MDAQVRRDVEEMLVQLLRPRDIDDIRRTERREGLDIAAADVSGAELPALARRGGSPTSASPGGRGEDGGRDQRSANQRRMLQHTPPVEARVHRRRVLTVILRHGTPSGRA